MELPFKLERKLSVMASVEEHYDNLLAQYYTWISGGYDFKINENRIFFRDHGIRPRGSGVALDLGAGTGFQTIPLAESGFKVIALDINGRLLAELKQKARNLPVVTVRDSLLNLKEHSPEEVEIITCMGDTLSHLNSLEEVQQLLQNTYALLGRGGGLILSFRDLTEELSGLDRIIPVKSDADRIFTCFLEYETTHVKVHDIVYEKVKNQWEMKKSVFKKLRISPQWIRDSLMALGYQVAKFDTEKGIVTVVAHKPS